MSVKGKQREQSISVLVPVYNGAPYILEALGSLCEQTVLPLEVVVVDDASTDDTCSRVESFAVNAPMPIRLIRLLSNTGGPYKPASIGFERIRGQLVTILDCDDLYAPDAFATYLAMFEETPDGTVGLATSDYLTFDERGVRNPSFFQGQQGWANRLCQIGENDSFFLDQAMAVDLLCDSFCLPFKGMLTRHAWEALSGPNLDFRIVCDCDFVWRLARRFCIRVSPKPLVKVRHHANSMSRNEQPMNEELVRLFQLMLRDVNNYDQRRRIRARLDREIFHLTYQAYRQRNIPRLVTWGLSLLSRKLSGLVR